MDERRCDADWRSYDDRARTSSYTRLMDLRDAQQVVVPGVPNGMPAPMRMVSPGFAKPSSRANLHGRSTISATLATSSGCAE
jgi:hypothetical protein